LNAEATLQLLTQRIAVPSLLRGERPDGVAFLQGAFEVTFVRRIQLRSDRLKRGDIFKVLGIDRIDLVAECCVQAEHESHVRLIDVARERIGAGIVRRRDVPWGWHG